MNISPTGSDLPTIAATRSPVAVAPGKRAWQTPTIAKLDSEETEAGAAAATEVNNNLMCTLTVTHAKSMVGCTAS
ncbi:MAG: hypothetical protein RLZZ15_99 [Verrucomicrobiota bacterium]|jgi:hypothetical protein